MKKRIEEEYNEAFRKEGIELLTNSEVAFIKACIRLMIEDDKETETNKKN